MLNILLSGCHGRLGQAIARVISARADMRVAIGVDPANAEANFEVVAKLSAVSADVDVVIDCSHPNNLDAVLAYAEKNNLPALLATTGYDDAAMVKIVEVSRKIPIFQTANLSVGANLLMDLAARAAAILGEEFDIEIVERHHRDKLDAPSGTAIEVYSRVNETEKYKPVYDRSQVRKPRDNNEIGIHAVRGGSIIGDHDVIFAGNDEVFEIRHNAISRDIFAAGAARAVCFISRQQPGQYGMQDLIQAAYCIE